MYIYRLPPAFRVWGVRFRVERFESRPSGVGVKVEELRVWRIGG